MDDSTFEQRYLNDGFRDFIRTNAEEVAIQHDHIRRLPDFQ